tara:strand:+ start:200 stop:565 length:366 start_codon:yes stop_codon:yes gene_type:complete
MVKQRKTQRLTCVITGRTLVASLAYYERKVERAGGEDKLKVTYVCKEAKDLVKKGYDVEKVRDILNIDRSTVQEVDKEIIEEITTNSRLPYKRLGRFNINNYTSTKTDADVKRFLDTVLHQ